MIEIFGEWLLNNKVELLGAILGILYIFFSIRQNIFTWPIGLITSILYVWVFFQAKLYADMGLQLYYVVISIYGWYFWLQGKKEVQNHKVRVKSTSLRLWLKLAITSFVLYAIILYTLQNFTDSDVPYMDSITTSLSIVATWMLARKYLEHWLIWIFVDAFSVGLYIHKNLWATAVLFLVYTFMAVLGFIEWRKDVITCQKMQHSVT